MRRGSRRRKAAIGRRMGKSGTRRSRRCSRCVAAAAGVKANGDRRRKKAAGRVVWRGGGSGGGGEKGIGGRACPRGGKAGCGGGRARERLRRRRHAAGGGLGWWRLGCMVEGEFRRRLGEEKSWPDMADLKRQRPATWATSWAKWGSIWHQKLVKSGGFGGGGRGEPILCGLGARARAGGAGIGGDVGGNGGNGGFGSGGRR
uniref:Uncharacterized protein n=2 Tax=Oryza sativa subsp. japonica TaxID=39947 RepID=Q8W5H0_ORYSJ|nr:hypothetical protein [Oryza sativa Japonica Group]ABF99023.1 hypothetical protein LOC_Os03g55480 [Oryza sativa Japonica Group]